LTFYRSLKWLNFGKDLPLFLTKKNISKKYFFEIFFFVKNDGKFSPQFSRFDGKKSTFTLEKNIPPFIFEIIYTGSSRIHVLLCPEACVFMCFSDFLHTLPYFSQIVFGRDYKDMFWLGTVWFGKFLLMCAKRPKAVLESR